MHDMVRSQPTTRQLNLRTLVAQWGGGEALAKKLGYSNGSYVSHMATGHRPITEKSARRIETTLGLPLGWMDQDHGRKKEEPVSVRVNPILFAQAVEAVTTGMQELGVDLSLEKFEELVGIVYEEVLAKGSADYQLLQKMLRLAR